LAVVGSIDIHAYPEVAEFFHDLAQVYRDEIRSLYAAGCRYIQLDDTNLAYLCDPQLRAQAQERATIRTSCRTPTRR
jgi:5-methyltetrahydropteroyltriglutamate--homocysteine methyltransferase